MSTLADFILSCVSICVCGMMLGAMSGMISMCDVFLPLCVIILSVLRCTRDHPAFTQV